MSYLVTGGTGLLGPNVLRKIVQDGKEGVAFDIPPNIDQLRDLEIASKVKVVPGDMAYMSDVLGAIKR